MARLPTPGGDQGDWGNILNDFLLVAHNPDGTSKLAEIVADKYIKPAGGIPESDLSGAVQAKLNTVAGTPDHGDLTGLGDDDHAQYHNDARGDARYYTQAQLDNGQLDNRYYTETEVDNALSDKADADEVMQTSGNVLTYSDPTNQSFLRINIANDGSPTGDWPDRLVFYHNTDGTYRRTGGFNEFGEIRSDASRWNRVAMRAHGFGTSGTQGSTPQVADIFQVSLYRGGPVLLGVGPSQITSAIPIEAPNIGIPIKAVLDFDEQPDDPQPGDIYLIRPE